MKIHGEHGSYELGEHLYLWLGNSSFFPIVGESLLYKRFASPRVGATERACLERLIGAGRMHEDRKHEFFRAIAWPVDLIATDDGVEGVVLPYVDASYFDADHVDVNTGPRMLGSLFGSDGPPLALRLRLLADLAGAFVALEALELVHGDMSENNATWRVEPTPRLLVLDCDGLRRAEDPPRGERTAGWVDPRLEMGDIQAHDQASDRWALSLAVWRALVGRLAAAAPDQQVVRDGRWPPELRERLIEAFSAHRSSERPDPRRWHRTLLALSADEAACSQIEALVAGMERRPAQAADAGGVNPVDLADLVEKTTPMPRKPRPPRNPPAGPVRNAVREQAKARSRRRARVLLLFAVVVLLPVLAGRTYLYAKSVELLVGAATGTYNSVIGDPVRLRSLSGRVPGGADDCTGRVHDRRAPDAQASFSCKRSGARVTYTLFSDEKTMNIHFRSVRDRHPKLPHRVPPCPARAGKWRLSDQGRTRGHFSSSAERVVWTDREHRLVGQLFDARGTRAACTTWKKARR